jgi:hypothetical protein
MQLSSNTPESHSISLKMCNQAKRWVEGLFSSSKDVSRSQMCSSCPQTPATIYLQRRGKQLAISRRRSKKHDDRTHRSGWPDASGHYRTNSNSARQREPFPWPDALHRLTGRATLGVRSESRELPPRLDVSDRMWPDTPRVRLALCHALPLWVPYQTLWFRERPDAPVARLSSAPRWTNRTCWSGQTSIRSQTLGALRLSPRLELTGRASPP